MIGAAQNRVERSRLDRQGRSLRITPRAAVELQGRPRFDPVIGVLRKTGRISGGLERLPRQDARDLVLSVAVVGRSREHGHDDLGPEDANRPHHVAQDRVAGPVAEGLFRRLRVSEVEGPREELASPIHAACGEELARAHDAEALAELGPDQVLASFASRERKVRSLRPHPSGEHRQEGGVLIVGMSSDQQHALDAVELAHEEGRIDDARTHPGPGRGLRGGVVRQKDAHVPREAQREEAGEEPRMLGAEATPGRQAGVRPLAVASRRSYAGPVFEARGKATAGRRYDHGGLRRTHLLHRECGCPGHGASGLPRVVGT